MIFRQTFHDLVNMIFPGRNEAMRKNRLKRRVYKVQGPNHIWHVDGNDKIKPFGFCIGGAIDGWSHYLLWLKVDIKNSHPRVICKYYLNAIGEQDIVPTTLRVDPGTENSAMLDVHTLLREELQIGNEIPGYIMGSSTHNQRIEKFWGYLRQSYTQFYMDLFKDMVMAGLHDTSNNNHVQCLLFCFLPVIQKELQEIKTHWNTHRIRSMKSTETPSGIPEFLYSCPEAYTARNSGYGVARNNHDICMDIYGNHEPHRDLQFADWAYSTMLGHGWGIPTDVNSAIRLYGNLYSLLWTMKEMTQLLPILLHTW